MTVKAGDLEAALIDEVSARVRQRLPADDAPRVEQFVRQYYRWVPPEDLLGRSALDVYGAALAHWNLASRRQPGETKVRVYNPQFEQHGWQSTHTVVEIVSDDMPFLVDSVTMALTRAGYRVHLTIHPVVHVRRDDHGHLIEVLAPDEPADDELVESVLHVEVDRQTDPGELEALRADLERVLGDVCAAVEDWPHMRQRARDLIAELDASPPVGIDAADVAETQALLAWLDDRHFTFLGYREYDLVEEDGADGLRPVPGSGLGILRATQDGDGASRSFAALPARVRALARVARLLNLTKANSRATVHRPAYLDYVGVKRFDATGQVVGERRFLGLYTSVAYKASPHDVPIVRRKIDAVLARARFPPGGHDEKALLEILETYPRDELFQIGTDDLFSISMGILFLGERQRVRLFVRRDEFDRFLSCLVFLPRDRFNTQNRERIQQILAESLDGDSHDFSLRLSESVLVRIHVIVRLRSGTVPDFDVDDIERRMVEATRAWTDELGEALLDEAGEERGSEWLRRYGQAFPTAYRADWSARAAVADIRRVEGLPEAGGLSMTLYRPLEATDGLVRCKLFRAQEPVLLSDVLPMFEDMGLQVVDERPYEVRPHGASPVWIYDFGLRHGCDSELEVDLIRDAFQEAFLRVWRGEAESDGFNGLVLRAGLPWRDVVVVRAIARYLRQAGTTFSNSYMEETLMAHSGVVRGLVELFHARFAPGRVREAAEALQRRIEQQIDGVESLDQDRILRSFLAVVKAMLRTNHFQRDAEGLAKPYLAFKLDPAGIPLVGRPRPRFEIFVYSPRVEGVHLRGGHVARGGLRWSDRREDFRSEILGLMKAQTVKNALIVPVGAKGGFVLKRPPAAGRDALREEAVACYRTFIRGLLDLTDNIVNGEVVPPPEVVRYDGDDPYLVVAADKGTATFSDIANAVAGEYGFWLGDAFASGGSTGYDHKRMGITARGAWESVKRHFRELGTDVQSQDFTVVGIGDMSGDVFGNGMLLSEHTRLVAAFDHRHVFLDPDPDPAASHAERRRLFELPTSSWADYDRTLLSEGGGVWPRTAKSIALSPQVRAALGVDDEQLTPGELIRAILRAPVDLLWCGGIGAYVKASTETHADAADKANDGVRVDAGELRCRVVGEGANLALTQRGRIEYALGGGRINTDAIDNAAGVNCSDHEVNIKILLDSIVAAGDITLKQRAALLAEMTDAVAEQVLRGNVTQPQAISLASAQAPSMLDIHDRFMRSLEQAGKLDRQLERLPDADEIADRRNAGIGLTRPELAVLLAYSKITLYAELLDSDLPEDPYLSHELVRAFPPVLSERFPEQMQGHRLRREIIATHVTNSMVDHEGTTFAFRLREETGAPPAHIARAYAAAREVFDMRRLWDGVEALDGHVGPETQFAMLLEARKLVERATRWLLRSRRPPLDIAAVVADFAPAARDLSDALPELLAEADRCAWDERVAELTGSGVAPVVAHQVASLGALFSALDVREVAAATGSSVADVARVHFLLGGRLQLHWLRDRIAALPRDNRWQAMARAALRDDLFNVHGQLTGEIVRETPADAGAEARVEAWIAANAGAVGRCLEILADIRAGGTYDATTLPVALREVRNLIHLTTAQAAAR